MPTPDSDPSLLAEMAQALNSVRVLFFYNSLSEVVLTVGTIRVCWL